MNAIDAMKIAEELGLGNKEVRSALAEGVLDGMLKSNQTATPEQVGTRMWSAFEVVPWEDRSWGRVAPISAVYDCALSAGLAPSEAVIEKLAKLAAGRLLTSTEKAKKAE